MANKPVISVEPGTPLYKALISATGVTPRDPAAFAYIVVDQAPEEVSVIDRFNRYAIEYPVVLAKFGDTTVVIDESYITAPKPNPAVPGLYAVDYLLTLPGAESIELWKCYVAVDEPPVLRGSMSTWSRTDYTLQTLNRILVEPTFNDMLEREGAPLYRFMTSNSGACLDWAVYDYMEADPHTYVYGEDGDSMRPVFVVAPVLPEGTMLYQEGLKGPSSLGNHIGTLGDRMLCNAFVDGGLSGNGYNEGEIASYSGSCYRAKVFTTQLPGQSSDWERGYLYRMDVATGVTVIPNARTLLCRVDVGGYQFKVNLKVHPDLGPYRGYYSHSRFADYNKGDLVSYIREGVVFILVRNDNDIIDPNADSAVPTSYMNPYWSVAYQSGIPLTTPTYGIYPDTNAVSAVLAKTQSVSCDVAMSWARMFNIPEALMIYLGGKAGAFMMYVLTRYRNTPLGFRTACNALGIGLEQLKLSDPSVRYFADGAEVSDVFTQIEKLRAIGGDMSRLHDTLWYTTHVPTTGDLCYDTVDTTVIKKCPSDGTPVSQWDVVYRMDRPPAPYLHSNAHYKAELSYMARLYSEMSVDMGDAYQWIRAMSAPTVLDMLGTLLMYEIPIYIMLETAIRIAETSVLTQYEASKCVQHGASYCGAQNLLYVHPYKDFDPSIMDYIWVYPEVYFRQSLTRANELVLPERELEDGTRIYRFDVGCYIGFQLGSDYSPYYVLKGVWQSVNTLGLLGDGASQGTEDTFIKASDMQTLPTSIFFTRGDVGVTVLLERKPIQTSMLYGAWQYKPGFVVGAHKFVDLEPVDAEIVVYTPIGYEKLLSSVKAVVVDGASVPYSASPSNGTISIFTMSGTTVVLLGSSGLPMAKVTVTHPMPRAADGGPRTGEPSIVLTLTSI